MQCLSRIGDLLQRGRDALQAGRSTRELRQETTVLYNIMKLTLNELHHRLKDYTSAEPYPFAPIAVKTRAHYQRTYALGLATAILLNRVLSGLVADSLPLSTEAQRFSKQILALSVQVAEFRPVAASYMTLCLITAWGGAADAATKMQAEEALKDYLGDFAHGEVVLPMGGLESVFRRMKLGDMVPVMKEEL
jgi:hypothetical protein